MKLLLRFEAEEMPSAARVAVLARQIRELAERHLPDLETRYGFVVDVLEPRPPP